MSIYGLLIGIAVVFTVDRVLKSERRIKYGDIVLILSSSLIFSRILFVLHNIQEVREGILNPFNVTDGGLTLYGALTGLLLSLWLISRVRKIEFLKLSDLIFLYVPLIQSIGRWGNYFNNELYGKPSTLPWAIEIPLSKRLPGFEHYSHFHPVFFYESILDLTNYFYLRHISKKKIPSGTITSLFLIIYGVIRIFMNTLRIDKEFFLNVETSDISSIISILIGILILVRINTLKKKH